MCEHCHLTSTTHAIYLLSNKSYVVMSPRGQLIMSPVQKLEASKLWSASCNRLDVFQQTIVTLGTTIRTLSLHLLGKAASI